MRTRGTVACLWAGLALVACAAEDKEEAGEGSSTDDTSSAADGEDTGAPAEVDCEIGLLEGDCAPDFTLADADGADRSLSDFRGQRVVIIGTAEW